jgi:hypothetical protein
VVVTVSLLLLVPPSDYFKLNLEVNHDDFISRWRNTNFPRDEALSQIL